MGIVARAVEIVRPSGNLALNPPSAAFNLAMARRTYRQDILDVKEGAAGACLLLH